MANSPRDGRSGSGPLDTDQAERLAELFQPSWEVGSDPASPKSRAEMEKFGTTTAPEVPVPVHKKTLVGLPVPTPVMPASKAGSVNPPPVSPVAQAAAAAAAAKAASKKTLMGVAPPAVGRSTSRSSQPPSVKVPSHAPPPPPPPPPPDLAETQSWAKGSLPTTPRVEPAAKSSPRSSRPSGVAKAYVPKEDPHTPAVVVDEAALRDGEAAAAAEDARRRARAEAARHAKTMRARPGELGFEHETPKKSRKLLWVLGAAAVGALGIGGFLALKSSSDAPIGAESAESGKSDTTPAEPIPTVASPESLPVESPAPPQPPEPAAVAAPEPVAAPESPPARGPARAEVRPSKPQPASRQNAAPAKRASDAAPSRPAQSEPKKTAEPQKKNVIVRDAPF
jgi:hypothetical protein